MSLKQTNPAEFKRIRNLMKQLNFGLLYGMGYKTLWFRLFSDNFLYTMEEVKAMHATWHKTFPAIKIIIGCYGK